MTPAELTEVITVVSTYWPGLRLPSGVDEARFMRDAWLRLLGEYDQRTVMAAVDWLANEEREYFPAPSPGQIAVRSRLVADPSSRIPDVDQAMTEVFAAVATHGRAHRPEFSHPLIDDAVNALGWQSICNSTNPDMLRSQLGRMLTTATERHRRTQALTPSVRKTIANVASSLGLERGT